MIQVTLKSEDLATLVAGGCVTQNGVAIRLQQQVHEATGAEIREFYQKGWDSDYYYESEDASVQIEDDNGDWIAEDNQIYDLRKLGTVNWQGQGAAGSHGKKSWMTFEEAFLAWKRKKVG